MSILKKILPISEHEMGDDELTISELEPDEESDWAIVCAEAGDYLKDDGNKRLKEEIACS